MAVAEEEEDEKNPSNGWHKSPTPGNPPPRPPGIHRGR
jgi:hypothetical protein